jgi:hypothetical protein
LEYAPTVDMAERDLYEILEVPKTASFTDIKKVTSIISRLGVF